MPRKLTPRSSLETLKREAKRWLKALRDQDTEARARFERVVSNPTADPTLRDVQHALALEFGYTGWNALKEAVERIGSPSDARADAARSLVDAAGRGDFSRVTALLDEYPDIVSERALRPGHIGLRTALHHAVGAQNLEMVDLLLARGADPNVRDEGDNAMPIHFAAENGDLEIVKRLVEHGSDTIGTGDDHELEVIGWATCFTNVHREVADYLLAHGAHHTIFSATAMGDIEAIRRIVAERRADIDRLMDRTNRRRHPLHLAIIKKQPAALHALLELGADTAAIDAAGLTPLDQAALNGESAMVDDLLAHGAELALPAALILNRDVERLLNENAGMLVPGGRFETLIIRAAEQAPARVVELLLRHGAAVDALDNEKSSVDGTAGYTALHAAAFRGNMEAARVLLANGASVTVRDSRYSGTPAGWAAYAGHDDIRDLILQGPIDVFDAIYYDRLDRLPEIFERSPASINQPIGRLLSREPEPTDWTKSWWTPLAFAVVNEKTDAVRALLELGAEPSIRDPQGRTLREIAESMGQREIASLLDEYETTSHSS